MKTPTTFLNCTLMTSRPSFRLCRSAVLISAAIAVTSANAVVIGRLPSTSVTGGQVIGVKPNVFIIIDNNKPMVKQSFGSGLEPSDINFLKVVAKGLRETIKPMVGKVRLGFSTTKKVFSSNDEGYTCAQMKLDGHPGEPPSAYGPYGSGWGQLVPHRFDDEYYNYFSQWLGSMCALLKGNEQSNRFWTNQPGANGNPHPPAKYPYPYNNYIDNMLHTGGANAVTKSPLLDLYTYVVSLIADRSFIADPTNHPKTQFVKGALGTRLFQDDQTDTLRLVQDPLRITKSNSDGPRGGTRLYDAYAPINPIDGYPEKNGVKECRQNYAILISAAGSSGDSFFHQTFSPVTRNNLTLPDGQIYNPDDERYGYIYKSGMTTLDDPTKGQRISDAAFRAYTMDLRKDKNNVKPYWEIQKNKQRKGLNGDIPAYWDRHNDPATWQHLTTFVIGYTGGMPGWEKAYRAYDKVPDVDYKKYGKLEGYMRSIENGDIHSLNDEYFWERKSIDYSPLKKDGKKWFYGKKPFACIGCMDEKEARPIIVGNESYFFKKQNSSMKCDNTDILSPTNDYRSHPGKDPSTEENCAVFVGPKEAKNTNYSLYAYDKSDLFFTQMDLIRAGILGRGGSYAVDDAESFKAALSSIFERIESAMASGVTGGSIGGGSRITGTIQQAGGSNSVLFTTYMDEETTSGNLFTFKNCPLIQKKIRNAAGKLEVNPLWVRYKCGVRLWNAATVLDKAAKASNYLANKTIVPVKQANGELQAQNFTWANIKGDTELKAALQDGNSEALGEARLEWVNGRLQSTFSDDIKSKLRVRTSVSIPEENQRYSRGEDGKLVKDDNGTLIEAKTTRIPNRMGEIVYAAPQAVEPVGTLPAAHPLNDQSYTDFIKSSIIGNDRNNPARPAMVIVGANDGRLYGFTSPKPDAGYAELKFSFIPRTLLINGSVTATTSPNYNTQNAKSLVNGPFTVRDAKVGAKNASVAWGTYVVGTLGAGGNAIYALDISSGQAEFKWEVRLSDLHSKADDKTPISGTENMQGAIMAPPRIVWLRDTRKTAKPTGKWVVLVPSGYNSNEVSLLVLDLANGELLANIQTGARYSKVKAESNSSVLTCTLNELAEGSQGLTAIHKQLSSKITLPVDSTVGCDNGLGPLTAIDSNSDGGVDYVYAGDLLGHIWKFDLTEFFQSGKGKVAYNSPLFVAQTHGNKPTRQPITSMIEVADSQNGEGNMLYFGTGRLFNQEERGLNQQETFYAVWDNPRYFEDGIVSLPMNRASKTGYQYAQYVSIPLPFKSSKLNDGDAEDSILRDNKRFGDLRGIKRYQDSTTSTAYLACNLEKRCSANGIMGWAMDFPPANGEGNPALERVIDRGQVFENAIYFSSFTPTQGKDGESCDTKQKTAGGEGRFYSLNRFTGNYLAKSPFDLNNDNKRDEKDSIKVSSGEMGSGQGDDYATDENGNYLVGLAGVSLGSTNGSFVSLQGVPGINPPVPECDFTRQIIFPASVDTETGDPLTLTGCYQNRFNVWKQPVDE